MRFYNSITNFSKSDKSGLICINNRACGNNTITNTADTRPDDLYSLEPKYGLEVISNEEVGFFILLDLEEQSQVNINSSKDLGWWGLDKNYRLAVKSSSPSLNISTNFVGFVVDDDNIEKADILLDKKSMLCSKSQVLVYVSVEHLNSSSNIYTEYNTEYKNSKDLYLDINLYRSNGYDSEEIVDSSRFNINVLDFSLEDDDDYFYMDLWQHPSSWARQADLEYYSDEHFELIEKYLRVMKRLGQKVIDLIVSDFPWAGQMCFAVDKNPSRLYEYNIIDVTKEDGNYKFDYTKLDRYIDLCMKLGIDKEINIFGILGNWHGYDFGSPIQGYPDPIRIRYYDIDRGVYDYIRDKDTLSDYISNLFDHLNELGLIDITYVIGDEPGNIDKFNLYSSFLENSTHHPIKYKYALHSTEFIENYDKDLESFSINVFNLASYCKDGQITGKIGENSHKMTWYSCCFPQTFNIFIKSPLIESMLTGFYTYIWNMKGMLRWAYGLYVEDPISNIRYKPNKWPAGDMLYVYPNKDKSPLSSLREKNTLYGVQDFNIFKKLEGKIPNLYDRIRNDFGIKINIGKKSCDTNLADSPINGDIVLDDYPDYNKYRSIRNSYIKEYIEKV